MYIYITYIYILEVMLVKMKVLNTIDLEESVHSAQ